MIESEFLQLIAQYGFPMAMCLWFMFRTDKVIKENTDATNQLKQAIEAKFLNDYKKPPYQAV